MLELRTSNHQISLLTIARSVGITSWICVRRTIHENSQIYIEFFDIRATEAALRGLNGREIAGKQLKLAPTYSEGTSFTTQFAASNGEGRLPKMAFNNISSAHMGRHFSGILASTSIVGGSIRVMHNSVGSPVNSFIERHQSLDAPIGLPPSARAISASNPVGLQELGNPFDNSNTGIQSMPNLHPYLGNFANGSPYKSSSTFSEMVSDGRKANEGFMMSNGCGVGTDGLNGGVGEMYLFNKHHDNKVWLALFLMIISAVSGGITDLSFNVVGYAWQISNCFLIASYSLTLRRTMDTAKQVT